MGGQGIFKLHPQDENLDSLIETATNNGTITTVIQRYLPQVKSQGDMRVLIIEGLCYPLALQRIPAGILCRARG